MDYIAWTVVGFDADGIIHEARFFDHESTNRVEVGPLDYALHRYAAKKRGLSCIMVNVDYVEEKPLWAR